MHGSVRKLSDESPPYVTPVAWRTCRREDAAPMVPGAVTELVFDLLLTPYLFKQGHAMRVALSSSDVDH